jgi:hypothetical protein
VKRRLVGLALVVLTACALISTARNVPAEAAGQRAVPELPVTAAAEVPVCPGPETLQVPEGAAAVTPPGPVSLAGAVALPSALGDPGADRSGTASAPAATLSSLSAGPQQPTASGTAGSGTPVRVVVGAPTQAGAWRLDVHRGAEVPVVSAAQWTLGAAGDLRGLATTGCAPAATDSWLVGGGTQAGRRARLLLANPGVSPAVVDVTLLGPQGVVPAPSGQGVVIAPGRQKALYLDAMAPGVSALAVHVVARSGRVAAVLHDSYLRGTVPGGTDDVASAAPPATRQVIPGVSVLAPVPGPGTAAGTLPGDPSAPGAVAVRIADPDGGEAVVRVHLLGPAGDVSLPGGGVVTVPPRGVAEVPVTGVPDGLYAAVVDSDTPVVAAAVVGRARVGGEAAGTPAGVRSGVPPAELAWAVAARPLQATTAVAIPAAASLVSGAGKGRPTPPAITVDLALASTGADGRVVLAEVGADGGVGAARTVQVQGRHSVQVTIGAGTTAVLVRADPAGAPVVAALVIAAADAAGPMLSVQPLRPGPRTTGDAPTVTEDLGTGLAAAGG